MDDWTASATAAAVPPTRAPDCPQPVTLTRPAPLWMTNEPPYQFGRRTIGWHVWHRDLEQPAAERLGVSPGLPQGYEQYPAGVGVGFCAEIVFESFDLLA